MKFILKNMFIILFTLLILYRSSPCQSNWSVINNSPTSTNLSKCFFINNNTGWISGDSGIIVHTSNGGANWNIQITNITKSINALFFINERLGWAAAFVDNPDSTSFYGTILLKTTNGGVNWINYMYPDTNKLIRTIYFLDSLNGFMGSAPASILHTTDAGNSWFPVHTDSSQKIGYPIEKIKFYNNSVGYASGGLRDLAGAMWTSTDGGLNWSAAVVAPEPLYDIYIFDISTAIAVGGDFEFGGSFVKTTDQGANWNYHGIGAFGVSTAVDFRTPSEGWISLPLAQKFSFTLDTGKTWTTIYTPDSVSVSDIQFTDSLNGWAAGYNGVILKFNSGIASITFSGDVNNPESLNLFQNYPNPFNPKTIINYQCSMYNFVSLKVYDVLGNTVTTLVNEKQQPGNYSVAFDAENLSSGIYFYNLSSGNFSVTKKMAVLK